MENTPPLYRLSLNTTDFSGVSESEVYRFLTTQYLHQNQLSWSRLQTTFAIEAGILAWFFSAETCTPLVVVGMILGSITVWLLHQLILRDWEIRDQNNEKLDKVHEPLGIKLIRPATRKWFRGSDIAGYLTFGCIIVNLMLAVLRLYGGA